MVQEQARSDASQGTLPIEPDEFKDVATALLRSVTSIIVGQDEAVRGVLLALLAEGHALLEGVPGVGKTSLVRAFARAIDLEYKRIQFTPDLMPADITGTNVLVGNGGVQSVVAFQPGPIFANLVLADEVNRATPKTQSALLEAMQERTVTAVNATRPLPRPFCVLATENPVEMQGTYPLPEAQLDRFLLKLFFDFPNEEQLSDIVYRTAGEHTPTVTKAADAQTILRMIALVHSVPMARHVVDFASRLVLALQPDHPSASPLVKRYVRFGPSPRGVQALCLAGRVLALLDGRINLAIDDIREIAPAALRHRIILTFDSHLERVSPDAIIADALADMTARVPV